MNPATWPGELMGTASRVLPAVPIATLADYVAVGGGRGLDLTRKLELRGRGCLPLRWAQASISTRSCASVAPVASRAQCAQQ